MSDSCEDRIAALEAELAATRREFDDFAATVSHDLRAPLRHIVSYVALVQEDAGPQLSAEVQGFLATITESAHRMRTMLEALQALSQVGVAAIERVPVPLGNLVPEVCAQVQLRYPQRSVVWRIATDLPVVLADAAMLRQAVTHVVDNALKFTAQREHASIEVTAGGGGVAATTVLSLRDNGAGFDPAMQDRLFRAFGKLHGVHQFGGLGMGLALTRRIMHRLGGEVRMEGATGDGCLVQLELPVD